MTKEEINTIENLWSDFDSALASRKWDDCRAIEANTRELEYQQDAERMQKLIVSSEKSAKLFSELKGGLSDKEFYETFKEETGYDHRDYMDEHYP